MLLSPSTRRAWIEIPYSSTESIKNAFVALHPEGVDRNIMQVLYERGYLVALHPEGVDRNRFCRPWKHGMGESPSTRRAWIEIINTNIFTNAKRSPSTRRAWIEIETPWEECDENDSRPPPGGRG